MTPITLGLDLSLSCSGICFSEGAPLTISPSRPKITGGERLWDLWQQLEPHLDLHRPLLAAIETCAYNVGRVNMVNLVNLGEWVGVVRAHLAEREIPLINVAPSTLKLFACGAGNATKEEVGDGCSANWGAPPWKSNQWDDNQYDSFALARLAEMALASKLRRELGWNPAVYQQSVVKKLLAKGIN